MDSLAADAVRASRLPLTPAAVESVAGDDGPLSRVAVVEVATSTNTELLETIPVDPVPWPHMSALVADHQTHGRGRAGREWDTPAGAALTVSVVLRPHGVGRASFGWAPLVTGLAVVRALRSAGVDAHLKWPNDVIVHTDGRDVPGWGQWRKLAGILCETAPGMDAVVAGIGVNVTQSQGELPVPHATSLLQAGATSLDRVELLRAVATQLRDTVEVWTGDHSGDARDSASIAASVAEVCATIGWEVAVDVPSGSPVSGTAVGLSAEGGLMLKTRSGETVTVVAGDVRVRQA